MSKSIRIGTVFPKHLDLNGDQGNLLVLKRRVEAYGGSCTAESIFDSQKLDFDLVFIGHGSSAAWSDIENRQPDLIHDISKLITEGVPVLAIASGYVKMAAALGQLVQDVAHRSEFISVDGVVGYITTNSGLEPLQFINNSILTLLHGPVLVKNPALADRLLSGLGIDVSTKSNYLEELDKLASASRRIAFEH